MKDFEYLASLVLDQGVITVNGKDRTSFRDILNCGRPAYLSLLSLYGLQDHIHNNIIHMKTKGYFRFWKLVPLDFRKAI